jgi:hypothetical protein
MKTTKQIIELGINHYNANLENDNCRRFDAQGLQKYCSMNDKWFSEEEIKEKIEDLKRDLKINMSMANWQDTKINEIVDLWIKCLFLERVEEQVVHDKQSDSLLAERKVSLNPDTPASSASNTRYYECHCGDIVSNLECTIVCPECGSLNKYEVHK